MDELGRIVIPKEIRRYLNINEHSSLAISENDNVIVIEKLSINCIGCSKPISERENKSYDFIDSLCDECISKVVSYKIISEENKRHEMICKDPY